MHWTSPASPASLVHRSPSPMVITRAALRSKALRLHRCGVWGAVWGLACRQGQPAPLDASIERRGAPLRSRAGGHGGFRARSPITLSHAFSVEFLRRRSIVRSIQVPVRFGDARGHPCQPERPHDNETDTRRPSDGMCRCARSPPTHCELRYLRFDRPGGSSVPRQRREPPDRTGTPTCRSAIRDLP